MSITFKRPPLIASFFTLCAFILLCSLGTWQANKYIAKTADKNNSICSRDIAPIFQSGFLNIDQSEYFKCDNKLILQGELITDKLIPLGPRVHEDKVGYHIYAPLKGNDETLILVNLGWSESKTPNIQNTEISVSGTFLKPSDPNSFTPDNNLTKNEWFFMDVEQAREYLEIGGLPSYVLYAQNIAPIAIESFAAAKLSNTYLQPERHFQYASFWYLMALVLLVMYFLRFVVARQAD